MVSIESQVFLIGRWENFEDLEEKLTLQELSQIANAIVDKESANRKFLAALQGMDLSEESSEGDITDLDGYEAERIGFGMGAGLGYTEE